MSSRLSLPLAFTMLSWGFNFVALKVLYQEVSAPAVSLIRYLLMWAAMLPIAWLAGESARYPKGSAGPVLLQGFLSMGVYMVLFLEGMRYVTPAEGAILLATSPILTALMAAAFRQERFRWSVLTGGVVACAGVAMVVGIQPGRGADRWLGAGLISVSALVWALSAVLSRPLVSTLSPYRVLVLGMPGALPVLLPYGLVATLTTPYDRLHPATWASLAHVVLLAGVAGFAGFYSGVRKLGAGGAMLYQYFVPPMAAFFSCLVFGTTVGAWQLVGVGVVLAGVWWAMRVPPRPAA